MRKKLEEIEEEKLETTDEFAFQTTENATELNASANNETPEIEPHQEIPAVPEAKEEPTPEPAPAPVFEAKPTTNVVLNSDLELEPSPKEIIVPSCNLLAGLARHSQISPWVFLKSKSSMTA